MSYLFGLSMPGFPQPFIVFMYPDDMTRAAAATMSAFARFPQPAYGFPQPSDGRAATAFWQTKVEMMPAFQDAARLALEGVARGALEPPPEAFAFVAVPTVPMLPTLDPLRALRALVSGLVAREITEKLSIAEREAVVLAVANELRGGEGIRALLAQRAGEAIRAIANARAAKAA